jgi:hypothetical protein
MFQYQTCGSGNFRILKSDSSIAGFVAQWQFGFMAYDETGFQLGNFATFFDAGIAVIDPPDIYRGETATIDIPRWL